MIDQGTLHRLLDYDCASGNFRWKVIQGGKKPGDFAGGINTRGKYRSVYVRGKSYQQVRLIWLYHTGEYSTNPFLFKDGDILNTRIENIKPIDMKQTMSAEFLKDIIVYNRDTGEFTWRLSPRLGISQGSAAGRLTTNGYVSIGISGKEYLAHRLAWLYEKGKWPVGLIDHINRDRKDNKFCNLRDVSPEDNAHNVSMRSDNTSGQTGVYFNHASGKWVAYINVQGKRKYLSFSEPTREKAVELREAAENTYYKIGETTND